VIHDPARIGGRGVETVHLSVWTWRTWLPLVVHRGSAANGVDVLQRGVNLVLKRRIANLSQQMKERNQ
jgi:hypothetical protein